MFFIKILFWRKKIPYSWSQPRPAEWKRQRRRKKEWGLHFLTTEILTNTKKKKGLLASVCAPPHLNTNTLNPIRFDKIYTQFKRERENAVFQPESRCSSLVYHNQTQITAQCVQTSSVSSQTQSCAAMASSVLPLRLASSLNHRSLWLMSLPHLYTCTHCTHQRIISSVWQLNHPSYYSVSRQWVEWRDIREVVNTQVCVTVCLLWAGLNTWLSTGKSEVPCSVKCYKIVMHAIQGWEKVALCYRALHPSPIRGPTDSHVGVGSSATSHYNSFFT